MNWQTRRRLLYALATVIFICAATLYFLRDTIFPAPTCFDNKQNGYESGIDCGGVCALTCKSDVIPLSVMWSRAIKTSSSTYDLAGMVSNKNIDNASHGIAYAFTVYDTNGNQIGEFKGTSMAPVDGDFPIINQSVKLDKSPAQVTLTLGDGPHYKVNEKPTSPTLRIGNESYSIEGGVPRVYATIMNTKRVTISNLPVRVVLFDIDGNAYAVGQTVVPFLNKEEVKDISFTWDSPLPYPPTRIRVYPIFDPFVAIE